MNTNVSSTFSSDIENYIQEKTLPLVQRQLVAYQFGDPLRLPKNRGTQYTASRYDRVNLPITTLSEGVPPVGQSMSLVQVSAIAQQWGDIITLTDVADLTIKHPLFQKAIELASMQMSETLERNTFNNLMAGTQINYAGTVGARASLVGGNVLTPHEINRAAGALYTIGAPQFNGQMQEDEKVAVGKKSGVSKAHYAAIMHPLVEQDMRENATVVTAWSYSEVDRLYNNDLGDWGGVRFTRSNMVPFFVGVAAPTGSPSDAAGSFSAATSGGALAATNYYIQIVGAVAQNGYETRIGQVTSAITVGGSGAGSISVVTPNVPGYLFNIYIGTSATITKLGATTSGPTSGPLAGQAVGIAPNTTVVITAVGASKTPPAPPATGVTVFPTFIFGKGAYGQVMLDDAKFSYLKTADKSDPLNQSRVVGWKVMYGTIILNQQFMMRIESSSAFSASFG